MAVVQVRLLDLDIQTVQPAVDPTTKNISSGEPWQGTKWNQPSSYETFGKSEPSFQNPICVHVPWASPESVCAKPQIIPLYSQCVHYKMQKWHMASLVASSRKAMGHAWKFKKGKSGNERKHSTSRHESFTFGFLWMSQELAISCQAADAQHVNFVVHLSYCLKSPPGLQRTFIATLQICLAPSQDA